MGAVAGLFARWRDSMAGLLKTNFENFYHAADESLAKAAQDLVKAWAEPRCAPRIRRNIGRYLSAAQSSRIFHAYVTSARCRVERRAPEHFVAGGVIGKCAH